MSETSRRPVVVIGGGPIGLAAAAHLVSKGETPLVLEAGSSIGAHVLAWGHVQVFSPWRYNVDPVAAELLRAAGWKPPPAVRARAVPTRQLRRWRAASAARDRDRLVSPGERGEVAVVPA